jgi:dTDP-4-amino-4,6-dideoxygalactose transaminase
MVPFVDLRRQNAQLSDDLHAAFESVIATSDFVLGDEVEQFEREFARFCTVRYCVGVASGTAALTIALLATGIQPGDEVIVPAHTYIASPLAVLHAGGVPVFCDVRAETGLIDVESAAARMSERTVAIMAVHLYGQVCDMAAVKRLAERYDLMVIEDAAQAHGARRDGERAGSFGAAACFSFYPSKNLGALGDGGAICTNDSGIAERARSLRNLGQHRKGEHVRAGLNERLDGIQAAMLRVKLRRLDRLNAQRRTRASLYQKLLPSTLALLEEDQGSECVYHLFPVRFAERDTLRSRLAARGVQSAVHYSPAAHLQPPFRALRSSGDTLPGAVGWARQELSLPMFPEITEDEVRRVSEVLHGALEEGEG